jgi:C_GCAxxG_C_C family probable redox protein
MWESEGLGSEDVLWAATAFNGGIARQQEAPCGALSSGTVCLGLRHRSDGTDREKANQARNAARHDAHQLVDDFRNEFGAITCTGLIGVDLSDPEGIRQFTEGGIAQRQCFGYVKYIIARLYEMAGINS